MQASARRALDRPDFERMNLPQDYWRAKVQGVPSENRTTVERYLIRIREMAEKGIGLLVTGDPGVGKSSIAALAAKEARSRGYSVFFVGVWELREAVRARIQFEDEVSIMDRCREVDLLVLDGLREEDAAEMFVNERTLEELVANRRAAKKVTILTTRVPPHVLRGKMAALFEATVGALVAMTVTGSNQRSGRHRDIVREVFGETPK